MWSTRIEQLTSGFLVRINLQNRPARFSEVIQAWQSDQDFRAFFNTLLGNAPFSAFRWETPPITKASRGRPFECVLLNSPGLASSPDPSAFEEHFGGPNGSEDVVSFPNLSNDAILIVPCPLGPASAYGHLAAFVRNAPQSQKHSLWKIVRTDSATTGDNAGLVKYCRSWCFVATR